MKPAAAYLSARNPLEETSTEPNATGNERARRSGPSVVHGRLKLRAGHAKLVDNRCELAGIGLAVSP